MGKVALALAAVPRYDSGRIGERSGNAVVVGASMAGLLAARVLADGFESVTLVEKDPLPDEPVARDGVPQARHAHLLLEAGRVTLEDLFPGYGEDLVSAGAVVVDASTDLRHYSEGDFLADGPERIPLYSATRPLFEQVVRRRVTDCDDVDVRAGHRFVDYRFDGAAAAVDGVVVRDEAGDPTELAADLVVDATGRVSRTPALLAERGYPAPAVHEVVVDVAYSTTLVERPPDQRHILFVEPSARRQRGGVAFPVEDDRRLVTLFGLHGDHPPRDADDLAAFAASLPVPGMEELLADHPWVADEIAHYPFPSNRRRRYEDLDRFPDGLLVVGDAVCSFNPIYGQGITVAALEALCLHHALAEAGREDLGRRFFARAEDVIDVAWSTAVGGDFAFPETEGPKPRGTDLFNWYLSRVIRTAHTDGEMRDAFYRVLGMEKQPTSLLRPGVVWRALGPGG